MSSVLESVEWGKPALSLLSQVKRIDTSRPSIMLIRHSERPQGFYATLTETGKKASYEYGTQLTHYKKVRLYHTYLERTRETAQQIHKALIEHRIMSQIADSVNLRTVNDPDKTRQNMIQVLSSYGITGIPTPDEEKILMRKADNPRKRNFLKWVGGHYSPIDIRPSLDFVQQLTAILMINLESAEQDSLDLYVCHDTWIAALLLHWCGIMPEIWVKYLEGFVVQPYEDKLKVVLSSGKLDVNYPHWWRF
jgi:hypothetical protein